MPGATGRRVGPAAKSLDLLEQRPPRVEPVERQLGRELRDGAQAETGSPA